MYKLVSSYGKEIKYFRDLLHYGLDINATDGADEIPVLKIGNHWDDETRDYVMSLVIHLFIL